MILGMVDVDEFEDHLTLSNGGCHHRTHDQAPRTGQAHEADPPLAGTQADKLCLRQKRPRQTSCRKHSKFRRRPPTSPNEAGWEHLNAARSQMGGDNKRVIGHLCTYMIVFLQIEAGVRCRLASD